MLIKIIVAVFGVLLLVSFIVNLLLLSGNRSVKRWKKEDEEDGTVLPVTLHAVQEGYTEIRIEDLDKLNEQIARLNESIGEERAAHKAEMVAVQSQAIVDVQKARAAIELEFAEKRRSEAKLTTARSRTALTAKITEHIAPLLDGFPFNYKEARWFGEIFDFIVFEGLEEGYIRCIHFVEVKTTKSRRISNPRERMLKDAIDNARVSYTVFRPDVELAKGNEDGK